jgi:hypothetical protein
VTSITKQCPQAAPAPASASDGGGVGPLGCRWHKIQRLRANLSLLLCSNLRPACPLGCRYSLASGDRYGSLGPSAFASMHVGLPEGGQGGCHAVQFILKSGSFLLELANYRLHQCSWHESILSPASCSRDGSRRKFLVRLDPTSNIHIALFARARRPNWRRPCSQKERIEFSEFEEVKKEWRAAIRDARHPLNPEKKTLEKGLTGTKRALFNTIRCPRAINRLAAPACSSAVARLSSPTNSTPLRRSVAGFKS